MQCIYQRDEKLIILLSTCRCWRDFDPPYCYYYIQGVYYTHHSQRDHMLVGHKILFVCKHYPETNMFVYFLGYMYHWDFPMFAFGSWRDFFLLMVYKPPTRNLLWIISQTLSGRRTYTPPLWNATGIGVLFNRASSLSTALVCWSTHANRYREDSYMYFGCQLSIDY